MSFLQAPGLLPTKRMALHASPYVDALPAVVIIHHITSISACMDVQRPRVQLVLGSQSELRRPVYKVKCAMSFLQHPANHSLSNSDKHSR